jgi:hypothetical protein
MHTADFTGKALLATAMAATLIFSIRAQSQTEAQDPLTFEVASVKPVPDRFGLIHQLPGNQTYEIKGAWLRLIMTVAYQVTDRQISGDPSWMSTDAFSISWRRLDVLAPAMSCMRCCRICLRSVST